jgi:hypothetical protein
MHMLTYNTGNVSLFRCSRFGLCVLMMISFLYAQGSFAHSMTGDITRSSGGEPFGGERIGTVSIHSTDRRTTVSTDLNASSDGNMFEGSLVDAGGSV